MIAIFPEIARHVATDDVEKLAVIIRKYHRESRVPDFDVLKTVEFFGIKVVQLPVEYFGAIACKDEKGRFEVAFVLREGLMQHEQRFLLAYLLGAFFLELQPKIADGGEFSSGFRVDHSPMFQFEERESMSYSTLVEKDLTLKLERFISAFLLPRGMFERAHQHLKDNLLLARFFAVSEGVIKRRMVELAAPAQEEVKSNAAQQKSAESVQRPVATMDDLAAPVKKALNSIAKKQYHDAKIPAEHESQEIAETSIKKIRKLAQLIDKSVDA